MSDEDFDDDDLNFDEFDNEAEQETVSQAIFDQQIDKAIDQFSSIASMDDVQLMEAIYYLWALWADFSLHISQPFIKRNKDPKIIEPAYDKITKTYEHVYPIYDYNSDFVTSPGNDLLKGSRAMGKLFNTVEKIITLMLKRVEEINASDEGEVGDGGQAPETRVAFGGHEYPQRKAFESIINLEENVVVINFDPGEWGERHLKNVRQLADKGFGFPKRAPRVKI